jgi:hypothetical protein
MSGDIKKVKKLNWVLVQVWLVLQGTIWDEEKEYQDEYNKLFGEDQEIVLFYIKIKKLKSQNL